jgi:hypothetical protein
VIEKPAGILSPGMAPTGLARLGTGDRRRPMNTYSIFFSDGSEDLVQANNVGQAKKKAQKYYSMGVEKAVIVKDPDASSRLDGCRPCELGDGKSSLVEPPGTKKSPETLGDAKNQSDGSAAKDDVPKTS